MAVPQNVKLARHPIDLDDDGHEFVELGVTTETDTDLVLAPDGTGGVEWVAGGGDTSNFVTKNDGGLETLDAHGSAGSTETLDLGDGNWHSLTLNADCTITVVGFTAAAGCSVLVKVTQDGTGGWAIVWDADIIFAAGADDQPAQGIGDVSWFVLASDEGDTVIYGFPVGGGGSTLTPATTVEAETTFGITPAVGTDLEYARQDHTHGTPATPSGAAHYLVIASSHSTPLVFGDLVQTSDGSDLIYTT